MASKRRHADSESVDALGAAVDVVDVEEDNAGKKIKSEKNGKDAVPAAPTPSETTEKSEAWMKIAELTNDTIRVEWNSVAPEATFTVTLEKSSSNKESQSTETTAGSDKKCSVVFSDLTPLTKYSLKITSSEKGERSASVEAMTPPSLEMPEIEEVQEGCAHLTIAPLPEEQAKDVEGYLLLVRPLEDAKDFPAAEIKDSSLKSKLESLVKPPFYVAYEFTQGELSEETGGQVQVGSGAAKKDGKFAAVQDPKLTSGGNYRVVLVVIMNFEGSQMLFAEESCQMLVE